MKKTTFLLFFLLPLLCQAQIKQDFDSLSNFTWDFGNDLPTAWVQYNQDGLTPDASATGTTIFDNGAAWGTCILNMSAGPDTMAISGSQYTPVGTSNDWLVTPGFTVPAPSASGKASCLTWEAYSLSNPIDQVYEVRISTTGNTVADFASPALYTSESEPFIWWGSVSKKGLDLSAYVGQTIYVAFINKSTSQSCLLLDDIQTEDLDATPDIQILPTFNWVDRFAQSGTQVEVIAFIRNKSGASINNLTVLITPSVGAPQTVILPVNMIGLLEKNVTIPINMPSTAEEVTYNFNLISLDGNADPTPLDNVGDNFTISSVVNLPTKAVLIEEGTSTANGSSPSGMVDMEYMYDMYAGKGSFVGVAAHLEDSMQISGYVNNAYAGACSVDRLYNGQSIGFGEMEKAFNLHKDAVAPANIGITPTLTGSNLAIALSVDFKTKVSTGLRLGIIVMEDSVTGTDSSYNQVNYYNGGFNGNLVGAGHDWTTAGDTVPAALMSYNHVARALLGGYYGQANSVPATVLDGQMVNYTFNYVIPANQDKNRLSLAAVIIDPSFGIVYNAKMVKLGNNTAINPNTAANLKFEVFPNPANESVNLAFQLENKKDILVEVFSMTGQNLLSQTYNQLVGAQNLALDTKGLAAGAYLVSISYEGNSFIQRLMIAK